MGGQFGHSKIRNMETILAFLPRKTLGCFELGEYLPM